MSYTDIGYDDNLIKPDNQMVEGQEVDPLTFDQYTQDISGSKINSGILYSRDGRLILNLEENFLKSSDGVNDIIRIGILEDGSIGGIFKGILQAGTLIGGNGTVSIEESNGGNGRIILYNSGIPSILIGDPSV